MLKRKKNKEQSLQAVKNLTNQVGQQIEEGPLECKEVQKRKEQGIRKVRSAK